MKIKQLHIYGFGKWQDQKWDLSEQQLSVIAGDNEAGKSTIRAFILFILFGLSPQQRQRYLPKRGGQLGGKLTVEGADRKDYTIERIDNRSNAEAICLDQNGQKQSADWLNQELNGVDRALYNQIFNFDVFDLQLEAGFSKEQLGEVLLSVGMTGSDRIYQTEKELKKVLDGQFKKQGSKPALNQLINQLVDQDRKLKNIQDSVDTYQTHQNKSQAYQAKIDHYRAKTLQLNQQLNIYVEQQRVYSAIENYHLNKQKLAEYPETIEFPEQGEVRFQQLKKTIQPLKSDAEVVKRQESDLKSDLDQIEKRLLPEQKMRQLENRLEQTKQYQEHTNEKIHLERQIKEKQATITTELNELKLNLTEAELEQLPVNYTTETAWQTLADHYHQTTKQIIDLEQANKTLTIRLATLEANSQDFKAKTLVTREKEAIETEIHQINQQFDQAQQKDHPLLKQQLSQRFYGLLSIIMMVASLALILTNDNNWLTGLLAGVILVVGVVFVWQQTKFRKKSLKLLNERQTDRTSELTERRDELMKKLTLHDNNRDQLLLTQEKLRQLADEQNQVNKQLTKLHWEQKQIDEAIADERSQFLFLTDLSVGFWPDLAKRLKAIIDLINQRDQLQEHLKSELSWLDQFEQETKTQLTDLIEQTETDFQTQLKYLEEQLIKQTNYREQEQKLRQRLIEQSETRKQIEAKLIPYEAELTELFKLANVSTEEQFLNRAQLYQEWSELIEKQAEKVRQIKLHLPESVTTPIMAGEFLTKNELELKVGSIREELVMIDEELSELVQREADQQAMLKSLAHSKEAVDLKHAFHLTEDKLASGARDWLVRQVALKQVEKTKAVFQTSYLPVVLVKASEFLGQLTAGRYLKLDFDLGSHELFLLAADQQTYRLDELSQGTVDQLFVSIRLAISSWLAEHIRLPFLIDDGFVHFDRKRKREMGQILAQLSDVHQIIYFTKDMDGLDLSGDDFIIL